MLKVATQFKDRVMKFAIASKDDYRQLLESVGFDDKEEHSVLIRSDDGSKYKMSEKFRYLIILHVLSLENIAVPSPTMNNPFRA